MKKRTKQACAYALMALSLVILPNCAKYHGKPLQYPNNGHTLEIKNVSVTTKKLSPHETKSYFCTKYLGKKYDAIQLYINNKSTNSLVLNASNIGLSVVPTGDIYKKIKYNTTLRALLYTPLMISALFLTTVAGLGAINPACPCAYCVLLGLGFAIAVAGTTALIATTTGIDYSRARKANKIMRKDLNLKVIGKDDRVIIQPGHISNKVIFAHKNKLNPQKSFSIKLTKQDLSSYALFDCKI